MILTRSFFLIVVLASKGNNKTASEKWGVVCVNADRVLLNFVPNRGRRWEKFVSHTDIIKIARKGTRNKNRQISAILPTHFKPFVQRNAEKKKKNKKEKKVGSVSKKIA